MGERRKKKARQRKLETDRVSCVERETERKTATMAEKARPGSCRGGGVLKGAGSVHYEG